MAQIYQLLDNNQRPYTYGPCIAAVGISLSLSAYSSVTPSPMSYYAMSYDDDNPGAGVVFVTGGIVGTGKADLDFITRLSYQSLYDADFGAQYLADQLMALLGIPRKRRGFRGSDPNQNGYILYYDPRRLCTYWAAVYGDQITCTCLWGGISSGYYRLLNQTYPRANSGISLDQTPINIGDTIILNERCFDQAGSSPLFNVLIVGDTIILNERCFDQAGSSPLFNVLGQDLRVLDPRVSNLAEHVRQRGIELRYCSGIEGTVVALHRHA